MNASAKLIEKELIDYLIFPEDDVLGNMVEKERRDEALKKVTALGNVFKQKVRILFEDKSGPKLVETTVWGTTPEAIELKDKVKLPIKSIREIQFYQ